MNTFIRASAALILAMSFLPRSGVCDDGDDPGGKGRQALSAPVVSLSVANPRELTFAWDPVKRAHRYRLRKDADGSGRYVVIADNLKVTSATDIVPVHLHDWINARYIVDACRGRFCTASAPVSTFAAMGPAIGYFKATNSETGDDVWQVALSGDGRTLAFGAPGEDSAAIGVNGDQTDNSRAGSGAVYVYTRAAAGAAWTFQAYLKASNADAYDGFGRALTLSADGNTLAVGAISEDAAAGSVDGSDNSVSSAGAVYVFSRDNGAWTQSAYLKAPVVGLADLFGWSVSLSGDGNRLLVGAPLEDSAASGVDGSMTDNGTANAGAAYLFQLADVGWELAAYLKASNPHVDAQFGNAAAISRDGSSLVVAAPYEGGLGAGINPDGTSGGAGSQSGAVYVFVENGGTWQQQAYIKAAYPGVLDYFGYAVALSGNGDTLAVGATWESSSATGIDGNQANNSLRSGAAYVFQRSGGTWMQQAYVKASNTGLNDYFGNSVALSDDGNLLAVNALAEDGGSPGINGDAASNAADSSGAVYVYRREYSTWRQQSYVKTSPVFPYQNLGRLSLSADGETMAVTAAGDRSLADGINGNRYDQSGSTVGAVFLY